MRSLFLAAALSFSAIAADQQAPSAMEALFAAQSEAEFLSALAQGKKDGLSKQVLLEARFIHHVDQQDFKQLAALSKELAPLYSNFDSASSQIFTLEDDWKAIVHFTQALAALELGSENAFQQHMLEAFWLSPRQAPALAPHIEAFKLKKAMAKLSIELSSQLPTLEQPLQQRSIGKLDTPAHLVFFWSPWSQEWIESIDAWKAFCHEAKQRGIHSTCILGELNPEILADAKSTLDEFQLRDHAKWLLEHPSLDLSRQLMIQTLPTAVLISSEGKVLYNGHPGTRKLQELIDAYPTTPR
ncbi:hypothetical protein [Rubritalea marina]|uniref:hypothetical protein n=1 Tax=Rubritalea marina TaxID=361055 RepID=UPI000369EE08|nr:hypothetical protein [Rubritalea marina]